jgi:hypothetical protein
MTRDPTENELATIRILLATSGSRDELDRWIAIAAREPKRQRGRPPGNKYWTVDCDLILMADQEFRLNGGSPTAAIASLANRCWRPELAAKLGANEHAVRKRLLRRLGPETYKDDHGNSVELWPTRCPQLEHLPIVQALIAGRRRRMADAGFVPEH